MNLSYMKCTLCDKQCVTPYHVSEPNAKGVWETAHLCEPCAKLYLADAPISNQPVEQTQELLIDVSNIKSPEELINLIGALQAQDPVPSKPPCPKCGLTIVDFNVKGRFGCPTCYSHFKEKLEQLVFPYHKGATKHVGKIPKSKTLGSELKTLKLQMAHAIEVENYEQAAELKKKIDALNQPS